MAREEAERERQAREQQFRDNVLLSTFATERDLLLTRISGTLRSASALSAGCAGDQS